MSFKQTKCTEEEDSHFISIDYFNGLQVDHFKTLMSQLWIT